MCLKYCLLAIRFMMFDSFQQRILDGRLAPIVCLTQMLFFTEKVLRFSIIVTEQT